MRRRPLFPALLVLALALAACTPAAAGDAAAGDGAPTPAGACPAASAPLASLELEADVRAVDGRSTACLPDRTIAAIDDDTAPALPVTVTDAEGRAVEITDASRILPVDISGTIAATVFALGLGDRVVGRDSSTDFAGTEDLPVVTKSGHSLNPEAILEVAPTVMLTDTTIGPKEVRQQLRDAGIAVVVISDERRIDTTGELVAEIAAALGVPGRGAALVDRLDAELAAARAEIAALTPAEPADRARMLFLYVRGSANVYYIFGADSGADSLIDAVGGVDVAAEIGWEGMKPMTAEALVAAQPDVLVMMTDGLTSVGGVDGLIERIPAIAQTPAGARGRIIDMADTAILSFGPRSAEIIRSLAGALYAPASYPPGPDEPAS
ncbi:ABC transporter substrate-binding protein [Microbacterium sp. W1N]|uniref:heme/hemin ABC transporter substrate-binding protein n=1 Tax=Microbacterium festucae TaxID=2977531 RepID=UPI0021BDFF01|nr:ABC transporter substrate-binding protein [Microbacterium festucae]MCT9819327.1 ABC transporter substrate-binding protein [Microbacterium festucae]